MDMNRLLEKYLKGNYQEVWQEMLSLGPLDRQSDTFMDIYTVAKETMLRVNHNILTIITRLEKMGYKFALPEYKKISPGNEIQAQIDQLESKVGSLPVSLIAFYEIVGGACLMGDYPGLASYAKPLATEPILFYSDPLVVFPIEAAFEQVDDFYQVDPDMDDPETAEFLIPIAPDDYHKENVSGGAPYEIAVPCLAADTLLLNDWHETTFVNYLRICFRWGGFPGWERYPDQPKALLRSLADRLIPI